MKLFINGSNRKKNSYNFLKDLMDNEDKLISLSDKDIKYCIGCNTCINDLPNYCVLKDDMKELYNSILEVDKIIIMSPIYMNHVTGILKNVIDRLNPFSNHELLKGKKIYLVTVGQMSEDENMEIKEDIDKYFKGLAEFMYFDFVYLKNLSSGDIETIDSIKETYENYDEIINELRKMINK